MRRMRALVMICAAFCAAGAVLFAGRAGAAAGYAEALTSEGKLIRGLTRDEAVRRYGFPDAVGSETWMYEKNGEKTYLYLPSLYTVNLYPKTLVANAGNVLEFKAYAGSQDSVTEDVTGSAEFIFSDPSAFTAKNNNVYVAKREGDFTLIVKYKGRFSNSCKLEIKARETEERLEQLIKIEVLPYQPVVYEGEDISFTAMGVYRRKDDTYEVRDISDKVSWFTAVKGSAPAAAQGRRIAFPVQGETAVFATLEDIKAYPQTVVVEMVSMRRRSEELRHLTIMPEFMTLPLKKEFRFTVMATYQNNVVREVTGNARFTIKNTSVALIRDETFKGVHEGISEVYAEVAGLRSENAKVTISDSENLTPPKPATPREKKIPPLQNAAKDIDREVDKLLQNLSSPEKKILSIRLTPLSVYLDKGTSAKVNATAFNSDGSNSDVSFMAEWQVADRSKASVERGSVTGKEPGETELTASYKGVKSSPAFITVRQPRLASIALTPESVKTSRFDRPVFKAEGVYTDSTRRDITKEVSWRVEGRSCLVDGGKVRPIGFGVNKVYARMDEVESLPATVKVVVTPLWVLLVCAQVFFGLILLCCAVLFMLYRQVCRKAKEIRMLKPESGRFVIALHANLKDVLSLFGFRAHPSECPLVAAGKADKTFAFGGLCTALTGIWEEIRFSTHEVTPGSVEEADKSYAQMLSKLFTGLTLSRKSVIFLRSLLRKIPLTL